MLRPLPHTLIFSRHFTWAVLLMGGLHWKIWSFVSAEHSHIGQYGWGCCGGTQENNLTFVGKQLNNTLLTKKFLPRGRL